MLCGGDLLASFAAPGVWEAPGDILREHGVICVDRPGSGLSSLLAAEAGVLADNRANVMLVEDPALGGVSSTLVRSAAQGQLASGGWSTWTM